MARMEILRPSGEGEELQANREDDGTALVWAANTVNKFQNTGNEMLRIVKGSGQATLTMETRAPDRYGLELPDREITIAANSDDVYLPFSPEAHNERDGDGQGLHQHRIQQHRRPRSDGYPARPQGALR